MKDDSRMLQALSAFHCVNDGSVALFTSALPVMSLSLGLVVSSLATHHGSSCLCKEHRSRPSNDVRHRSPRNRSLAHALATEIRLPELISKTCQFPVALHKRPARDPGNVLPCASPHWRSERLDCTGGPHNRRGYLIATHMCHERQNCTQSVD